MSAHIEIDTAVFDSSFGRQPFLVRHHLAYDPRFAIDALVALARRLPPSRVEYSSGAVPRSLDPAHTPGNGLTAEQTLRTISTSGSWVCLKNVEHHPDYRALLDECLAEISPHAEALEPRVHDPEAFIFVSSPGAVTPFHMDPEQNFLLQVRGHKTMHVFDPADRSIVTEEALDRFYGGGHRNLPFRDEFEAFAQRYTLQPGMGLHVPVTAPHWVQNGAEVSISFSITFQTRASERRGHVHRLNASLRTWGWTPRAAGESHAADSMKQLVARAKARVDRTRARVTRRQARVEDARSRTTAR